MTDPLLSLPDSDPVSCRDADTVLAAFLDGELLGAEREDLETHLSACAGCRSKADFERAFRRRIRLAADQQATSPGTPAGLRANILSGIAREPPPAKVLRLFPRSAYPAAALAVAAGCAAIYFQGLQSGNRAAPFLAAAVANHRRELPMEVTDPGLPAIQSWFKGKVDFAPSSIPAIRNVNMLGARLSNLSDRQAALVTYGAPAGRRVSLFVFDAPGLEVQNDRKVADREVMIANQNGYNVALWKDKEIAYSLVSDLSEEDILQLVSAAGRQ